MAGLWTGNRTAELATSNTGLGVVRGQFIAIGVSAAVAAAQYLLRPVFDHSVYMLGAMALLACALFGGPWSILTASALLTAIAVGVESQLGAPLADLTLRALIFLITGVAIAAWMRRLDRQHDTALRAAAEQAEREALLQASLAIVADALVVVDDQGQIQSFSDAAERLFGWTSKEVVGRNFSSLMPPGEAVALGGGESEVEVSGSSRQVMGLNQHGEPFPMELRIGEARIAGRRFLTMVVRELHGRNGLGAGARAQPTVVGGHQLPARGPQPDRPHGTG